jgi:hypothetical protein
MKSMKGAKETVWDHPRGPIYVLQKVRNGTVGIQECTEAQGGSRRDIVFVEGSKEKAKVIGRCIIGGCWIDDDPVKPLIFWTNRKDSKIVSVQEVGETRKFFQSNKISQEIIEIALCSFRESLKLL